MMGKCLMPEFVQDYRSPDADFIFSLILPDMYTDTLLMSFRVLVYDQFQTYVRALSQPKIL